MWQLNINSINWTTPPITNQTVDISYREGGSSAYFTLAGTVIFKPDGTISGTPNPFVISDISDAWATLEVQMVNECNGLDVTQTFNKP